MRNPMNRNSGVSNGVSHPAGGYTEKHGLNHYSSNSHRGHSFANPIPLGLSAHALGCLVYGSYLANWRTINTPLLIAAVGLGIAGPGSFLAAIFCFIVNDTLWQTTFIILTGLWLSLGIAYAPVVGLATFYASTAEQNNTFEEGVGLFTLFFGLLIFVHAIASSRRNFVYPMILTLTALALWIVTASYFNHNIASSKLSKAAGYLFVIAGLISVYYVVAANLASEHFMHLPLLGHGHAGPQRLDDDIRGDGNLGHHASHTTDSDNGHLNGHQNVGTGHSAVQQTQHSSHASNGVAPGFIQPAPAVQTAPARV